MGLYCYGCSGLIRGYNKADVAVGKKGGTLPLFMDTKAGASLTQQWLSVNIQNREDLELAFSLAIDLRGEPLRWSSSDNGIILLANHSKNPYFMAFPNSPDATELARIFWGSIPSQPDPADSDGLVAEVLIPRIPDMGGLGGWNALNMLFWTEQPLCLVKFASEET